MVEVWSDVFYNVKVFKLKVIFFYDFKIIIFNS